MHLFQVGVRSHLSCCSVLFWVKIHFDSQIWTFLWAIFILMVIPFVFDSCWALSLGLGFVSLFQFITCLLWDKKITRLWKKVFFVIKKIEGFISSVAFIIHISILAVYNTKKRNRKQKQIVIRGKVVVPVVREYELVICATLPTNKKPSWCLK